MITRQNLKSVIFDLDGTLVDAAPDLHAAANKTLDDLGRRQVSLAEVISFIGHGVPKLVERFLTATGECNPELIATSIPLFGEHYARDVCTLTKPYPGVKEMLEQFVAAGVSLGVCTNKPDEFARALLEDLGLESYFWTIIGGSSVQAKKPAAEPLQKAMTELNVGLNACVFVGDSETDYLTARNAGVPFVFVEGGYQQGEIPDFYPDGIVKSIAQLADFLLSENPKTS